MTRRDAPDPDGSAAFAERVTRYLDDALPADDLARLNRDLAVDAQSLDRFVEMCLIEAMVAEEVAQQAGVAAETADDESAWASPAALSRGTPAPPVPPPSPGFAWRAGRGRGVNWGRGVGRAAAAAVLLAAGVVWQTRGDRARPRVAPPGVRPAGPQRCHWSHWCSARARRRPTPA